MSPAILGRRKAGQTGDKAGKAGDKAAGQGDPLDRADQQVVWRIASVLLDYPGPETLAMLDRLAPVAARLPEPAGPALDSFLSHATSTDPIELAAHYVQTFDMRRRHCLHLTYYAYGDTRKRGMALLRFKHAYGAAGAELAEHELPDHLSVLLEFAATVDPDAGRRLLAEYLPVLELLRHSLDEVGSPYRHPLDAVLATLPALNVADRRRVAQLAQEGPPSEDVGLDAFGMDPMAQMEMEARR